jgi:peptidoglycan/xylan/chitin deacetylase (PgdA/CDA1 family)
MDPRPPAQKGMSPVLAGSTLLHAAAVAGFIAESGAWPWLLAALAVNHAALTAICVTPRSHLLGPNIVRLPAQARAQGQVALTFDDGPDPVGTPKVLDILDRHGATASFFCIGSRSARDPGLAREIVARGHFVENHTFRHPNGFAFHSPRGLATEVGQAQDLLTELTGRAPVFFRPPMGISGPLLQFVLRRFGLSRVTWTRRGYDGLPADPDVVLSRLTRGLAAGDILVLHDGGPSGGHAAVQTLPRLLGTIADRGLKAVSLTHSFHPACAPGTNVPEAVFAASGTGRSIPA